jgi:hypothetical protein
LSGLAKYKLLAREGGLDSEMLVYSSVWGFLTRLNPQRLLKVGIKRGLG